MMDGEYTEGKDPAPAIASAKAALANPIAPNCRTVMLGVDDLQTLLDELEHREQRRAWAVHMGLGLAELLKANLERMMK